jgi:hypothetical protein
VTDNRTHKRYRVEMLDISTAILQTSTIETIDMSLSGISLHAAGRLNIGEQYDLKLRSKGRTLSLKGLVIWAKISRTRRGFNGDIIPVYTGGLEFIDVSKHLTDEINDFIGTHRKESNIRNNTDGYMDMCARERCLRRNPRFQVNTPAEAFMMDHTQCLPVQDLSFGGLRLERSQPIKMNSKIPMMLNFFGDKFILFKGIVVSCRLIKKSSPRVYTMGIAVSEMSMKDRRILSEHIRLLRNIDTSPS